MAVDKLPIRTRSIPLVLFGHDLLVSRWVADQLKVSNFGDSVALGITIDGKLVAGVAYYNYRHPNIEVAIASLTPRWATKKTLSLLFAYPFIQLECTRITCLIDVGNEQCRDLVERLGFIHEGTLREAHPGGDAALYGIIKSECNWLNHGQKVFSKSASGT